MASIFPNGDSNSNSDPTMGGVGGGVLKAMSTLLSRFRFSYALGWQYGHARDMYKIFGYKRDPKPQDYLVKYRRQDVAKRIVEAPADALWTQPPTIKLKPVPSAGVADASTTDNDENAVGAGGTGVATIAVSPEQQAFNQAWQELEKRFPIWDIFNRLDRLTAIGRYSVLLIGVKGHGRLDQALNGPVRVEDIIYLQPYGELSARIMEWETNPGDPRFGKPKIYEIDQQQSEFVASNRDKPSRNVRVHHSRIIHFAEATLEDNVFGSPRMEAVYNLLDDLLKIAGGTAETFWLTSNRGMQLDVDKDLDFDEAAAKALTDEVEEYEHQLRRFIRTRGVKINPLGTTVPDPSKAFDVTISLISAATGIPKRILLGAEAGQLASDQDRANWAVRVEERRANFGEPQMIRPFIRRFAELSVLPDPGGFECIWPEAFRMSPLEKNQAMAQKARSAMNLAKTMLDQPDFIDIHEARGIVSIGFSDQSLVPPEDDKRERKIREAPVPGQGIIDDGNLFQGDDEGNTGRTNGEDDV